MSENSQYDDARAVYRRMQARHQALRESHEAALRVDDPLFAPEEINAEADGVLWAIVQVEGLLNGWDAEREEAYDQL
jgi:hypothetical protein